MRNGQLVGSAATKDVSKNEVLGMIILGKVAESAIAEPDASTE